MAQAQMPDFTIESGAPKPVCGVDEAGRGPWAGPVVAAAVILDPRAIPAGLNDSKRLSAKSREALFETLQNTAKIGIGQASVKEIDAHNILQATFLAMARAVAELDVNPAMVLVDGRHIPPGLPCDARAIIGGDGRCVSIAAASIAAKVTRDRIMVALSQQFPGYAWDRNMGYGTSGHRQGLERWGVTQHHRRSFKPVHNMLGKDSPLST